MDKGWGAARYTDCQTSVKKGEISCRETVDTLSHKLALLEVEPRADKLYLVVAEAVIKKLSNSLAVVKVRKRITQRAS